MVMMRARQISFGGIRSDDYGAIVDGAESYAAAERDFTSVAIAGRSGELTVDNGRYRNVPIPYTLYFPDARKLEMFRHDVATLIGYHRLEDSSRPEEFMLARLSGGFKPTMSGFRNAHGQVKLTFDCQPQRFLKSGERAIPFAGVEVAALYNPTGMPTRPLIRVYGAGDVGIGAQTLTIAKHTEAYVDIDCALEDCFCGGINLNGVVARADYPELGAGTTGIRIGSGISAIEITPRWWRQ